MTAPRPRGTELASLSPSRASDFKVCPRLFRYRAVDRLETPPTPQQARGTTAHLALQRLFDLPPQDRTPERLFDLFRTAWMERKPVDYPDLFASVEEERRWGTESLRVLANYFAVEDPREVEPVDRELDLVETFGAMRIRGILDRLDEDDDGLVVVDYKTGKAPPERFALPAFFALKIYALLVRAHLGRTPTRLRLVYLGDATVYEIPVADAQLDAMERQLDALWTAIERALERDEFPPRPGPLCAWCPFQERCPAFGGIDAPGDPVPEP